MALKDLFGNMNIFGAGLPDYGGLLTDEQRKQIEQQALTRGLLGTAASYLAQPKTGGYGSALPYLGRAYLGGMEASQGAITQGLDTALKQKLLQEQKPELQRFDTGTAFQMRDAEGNIVYTVPKTPTPEKKPASYQEFELSKEVPAYGEFLEKRQKAQTSVNVNVGEKKLIEKLGTSSVDKLDNSMAQATSAQKTLMKINDVKPVLEEGVYSGPLSGAQRFITQLGTKLGVASDDATQTLKNTAEAMQTLASFELDAAGAMKGQGTITENERLLIQRAAAGRIGDFTSEEIQTLLNTMEKTAQYRISNHNRQLDIVKGMNLEGTEGFLKLYELPTLDTKPKRSREDILKEYGV